MLDFSLSPHAAKRAVEMALDPEEIRACLESPEIKVPSRERKDCVVYIRGRIAIPVNADTRDVVTILWNRYDKKTGRLDGEYFKRGTDSEMDYIRDKTI